MALGLFFFLEWDVLKREAASDQGHIKSNVHGTASNEVQKLHNRWQTVEISR